MPVTRPVSSQSQSRPTTAASIASEPLPFTWPPSEAKSSVRTASPRREAEALRPPASSSGESRATTASGVPGSRLDSRASSITSNVLPSGTVELPTILPNVELPQLVEQTSRETSKTIDAPSPPRCSREASKSQVPEDPAEAEEIRSDPVSDSLTATVGLDRSPPAEASKGAVSSQPAKASNIAPSPPEANPGRDVSPPAEASKGAVSSCPQQKPVNLASDTKVPTSRSLQGCSLVSTSKSIQRRSFAA
ncbi:unnamed protein product [Durusdinium trenchii]|uniref:Uncharacterized protein n=1 Tax=Durusdinium trenchii TaxID=1381693 RepID=A0ABP0IVE3_9DINO